MPISSLIQACSDSAFAELGPAFTGFGLPAVDKLMLLWQCVASIGTESSEEQVSPKSPIARLLFVRQTAMSLRLGSTPAKPTRGILAKHLPLPTHPELPCPEPLTCRNTCQRGMPWISVSSLTSLPFEICPPADGPPLMILATTADHHGVTPFVSGLWAIFVRR